MSDDQVHELAVRCLSTALGRPVTSEEFLVREESEEWDSLKHVELLFVVEDEIGVILDPNQLSSIVDLASLESVLQEVSTTQ
jgi:acyl carrier protein